MVKFEESLENPNLVRRFLNLWSFLDLLELKFCGHLSNSLEKVCAKFQLNRSSFNRVPRSLAELLRSNAEVLRSRS
jgi:hypothetical protein